MPDTSDPCKCRLCKRYPQRSRRTLPTADRKRIAELKGQMEQHIKQRNALSWTINSDFQKNNIPSAKSIKKRDTLNKNIKAAENELIEYARRQRCPFHSGKKGQPCDWVDACEACDPNPERPAYWRRWCFKEWLKDNNKLQATTDLRSIWLEHHKKPTDSTDFHVFSRAAQHDEETESDGN